MRKIHSKAPVILCYILSLCIMAYYILMSMKTNVVIRPRGRLILLGGICGFIYLGSLFWIGNCIPERKKCIMKSTFFVFFIMYVVLLATLILFDTYYNRMENNLISGGAVSINLKEWLSQNSNFIPFATIGFYVKAWIHETINRSVIITNLLGNIAAFVPFAFFLPLLFEKMKQFKYFAICVVVIGAVVEGMQVILRCGSCDIDDLILNAGGACLFFVVFRRKGMKTIFRLVTQLDF